MPSIGALQTYSLFYYGYEITSDDNQISIDEGLGEVVVEIDVGSYTITSLATALESALNTYLDNGYTVTVDRETRIFTISAGASFDLLGATGTSIGFSALPVLGIDPVDYIGVTSVVGSQVTGDEFEPQFYLQDYISTDNWQEKAFSTVNKSASGNVQVQNFGIERFMQCNIKYATNIPQTNGVIKSSLTGVEDLQRFMQNLIEKRPVEFMEDINDKSSFETFILEKSPDSSDGTGYQLKELYARGLPYYFETGVLKFRKVTV